MLDALSSEIREDIRKAFAFQLLLPAFKRRCTIRPVSLRARHRLPEGKHSVTPNLGRNASFFPELAYGYLTQRVSFEAFREARPDLCELD
jgi:hypothetical protein